MTKKKQKKTWLWRKTAVGRRSGDGAWRLWIHIDPPKYRSTFNISFFYEASLYDFATKENQFEKRIYRIKKPQVYLWMVLLSLFLCNVSTISAI